MTTGELSTLLEVPPQQVRQRLHPATRRGHWVMPVRGLWVPVPPEYRTWGAPPGIEIIDAMMGHLEITYYVGWLSAASLHGAAHHAPQIFQVAVGRHVRDRQVGRTRFSFAQRGIDRTPVVLHPTRAGTARVSTVASTMLDIATDVQRSGGIDNAATVITELADVETFSADELVETARHYPAAAARRIGWVLEHFSEEHDLNPLRTLALGSVPTPSRLDPSRAPSGTLDETWLIYLNRDVEPDL